MSSRCSDLEGRAATSIGYVRASFWGVGSAARLLALSGAGALWMLLKKSNVTSNPAPYAPGAGNAQTASGLRGSATRKPFRMGISPKGATLYDC
jgi:hypothetical protein